MKILFIHIPKCGGRSVNSTLPNVTHHEKWSREVGGFPGHHTLEECLLILLSGRLTMMKQEK